MKLREERERETASEPRGKSDNPLNISIRTDAQASFNPSNHIKHTRSLCYFHIKGPARCCCGFYARRRFDEFCQFSSPSTIQCSVIPLLCNMFKTHHPLQSALKFIVQLCTQVYYPGRLPHKDKGKHDLTLTLWWLKGRFPLKIHNLLYPETEAAQSIVGVSVCQSPFRES